KREAIEGNERSFVIGSDRHLHLLRRPTHQRSGVGVPSPYLTWNAFERMAGQGPVSPRNQAFARSLSSGYGGRPTTRSENMKHLGVYFRRRSANMPPPELARSNFHARTLVHEPLQPLVRCLRLSGRRGKSGRRQPA